MGASVSPGQVALGDRVQAAVELALLSSREAGSALLQSSTREPLDAALDGELRPFDQQRDRVLGIAVAGPRHREVNQQPEAGVRCAGRGECLL
jgi:hypothetical protein